jgi:predicted RNA-binding Zn ribbon-like protein
MTGERTSLERQPGGRAPAPGQLATVQAFMNSRWDLSDESHGETLRSPEALADWLRLRGLFSGDSLPEADLARCLTVREGLRALAFVNNGREPERAAIEAMRRETRGADVRILVDLDGAHFVADREGPGVDGAISTLLAISARAMIDGTWERFKACPGRDCGWVFYDHSRNRSGRWCAMAVCGDREKSRAYYRRKTVHDA